MNISYDDVVVRCLARVFLEAEAEGLFMAIQVSPPNVIGRDSLICLIWKKLAKKSLRFTAERRIGKTTVMTKMAAEPMEGFEVLFLEVEGIDTPDRFTEVMLTRMKPLLSMKEKAKGWLDGFLENVGGTEIGGVIKLPEKSSMGWQATMEKSIEGLCQHHQDRILVLMFDELPYMLQEIATVAASDGMNYDALTMLDTLRSLRQRHRNLRMVFAGSVGLHHVVTDLKQSLLASEPINDMPAIEIHALQHSDALVLATRLLNDEQVAIKDNNTDQISERIVLLADRVPFYMEAVVARLSELGRLVVIKDVDDTVNEQLTNDHDPWEMEHFRGRLETYYRGSITDANDRQMRNDEIARCILDHFAVVTEPQSIDQVWTNVRSQFALTDRQHIVQMLKSLGQDHYLICDTQKRYSFRFPLIQHWWKIAQGLSP